MDIPCRPKQNTTMIKMLILSWFNRIYKTTGTMQGARVLHRARLRSDIVIGLSHIRVYRLTYLRRIEKRKVRHTYVVDTWAYVAHTLRYVAHTPHTPRCYVFLCMHLKIRSTYEAGPIRRTYVTHTWYIRKQRGRYVVDT